MKSQLQQKYDAFVAYFSEHMPVAESELHYENPYQLLVAVILSAQCTDKRVNMVTPRLFASYPTADSLSKASESDVYEYIKSVSYPNSKSKHLVGMAQMLVKEYGGEVPSTLEELVRLPGVGRKTANVVQAVIWKKAAFAVDTHIFRVSHRLGLVDDKATTPYAVERVLTKYFPDELIPRAHHWLLLHGRYVCQSRKPKCKQCGLSEVCKYWIKQQKES